MEALGGHGIICAVAFCSAGLLLYLVRITVWRGPQTPGRPSVGLYYTQTNVILHRYS